MKLNVTIGCSVCNLKSRTKVELPFDCDTLLCPSCGNENCLSIIKVIEELSMFNSQDILRRLQKMRDIHA